MTPLMGEYDKDDYAFDFETTFKRSLAAQKGNKIMMELMAQTTLAFECHCLPVNMLIMASERQKESISGRARQKLKLVHDFTSIIITSNSATRKCATWGKQDRTEREWEWEWQWGLDWGFEQDSAQDAGLCSTIVCAHRGANEIERQTTWKWAFPFNALCSFFFVRFSFFLFYIALHLPCQRTLKTMHTDDRDSSWQHYILPRRWKLFWRKLIIAWHKLRVIAEVGGENREREMGIEQRTMGIHQITFSPGQVGPSTWVLGPTVNIWAQWADKVG